MMRQVYHTGWKKSCIDCLVEETVEHGTDTVADGSTENRTDRTKEHANDGADRAAEKYVAVLKRKVVHGITS